MQTKKIGFDLKSFDRITKMLPRLKILSFPNLRRTLSVVGSDVEIASYLSEIEIVVAADNMKAVVEINLTDEELDTKKSELPKLLNEALHNKNIVYGIRSVQLDNMKFGQAIVIAEGKVPGNGNDAIITYIEMPERRPIIREDGNADYYEMNFVTPVEKGDWLGEKIPPQEGTSGIDIFGNEIKGKKGLDKKLFYDRKSIEEVDEDGKIILRALHGGVLEFVNEVVSVGHQLFIDGDVGPETGSITFDGTVVITGTVLAGYSVNALNDISIEAAEAVTNAREIRSENGDIYIKGGVFGGGKTIIAAKETIYIKHANDCSIFAKRVHAGLYLLGSDVIADYIEVDPHKGRIIGGKTEATYRITCATAGNRHERNTILFAKGIDKEGIHLEVQQMAKSFKNLQNQIVQLETVIAPLDKQSTSLIGTKRDAYDKIQETLKKNRNELLVLDQAIQTHLEVMKTAKSPEIEITKSANPGVFLQIGTKSSVITSETKGVFELVDGVLNI
ncbi:DUF342 domain-containing protein [Sporosarcina aquimarina]|uniref:FapA family protein n=1 Tax=Sporosarcina aquimarina TaxID=114975 RepID=A0ABU4G2Y6_9BACL|nr:FapA family protein [Sporosarcina aquimarina]MDW0111330.1 FapA family protein [Sporosarcina aquimarina]